MPVLGAFQIQTDWLGQHLAKAALANTVEQPQLF